MRRIFVMTAAAILVAATMQGQTKKIDEQKRVIDRLEKQIQREEAEIAKLKKDKASRESRIKRLVNQINARQTLLDETQTQISSLQQEIASTDSIAATLDAKLATEQSAYCELVREAYRNYRHNNFVSYLLSATDFSDVARKITNLRAVSGYRAERLRNIDSLSTALAEQRRILDEKHSALSDEQQRLTSQQTKLQRDVTTARNEVKTLSQREKKALKEKVANERRLDSAVAELRRLTKGNKAGASFSNKTRNLNLPVAGGKVVSYHKNMAEITGVKGAEVRTIYDGKAVDIKRNKITGRYDVYIAHGEYITTYANLASTCVEKGAKVAKNQRIGTIGSAVNPATMKTEYKIVFGIYAPSPSVTMSAADCFKK